MNEFLDIIEGGVALTEDQMQRAMTQIMEGQVTDGDLAAFLIGLTERGENVDELTGAARVMRAKAETIKAPYGAVDCCGTGGDKQHTYNISTAVALVAASCGVPVAKHGNRAASSKSGAADVLEAIGVNLDIPKNAVEESLKLYNFAFLMAPHHHTAMKHVANVRKQLGTRTIFNLLGPLANPAATRNQLLGVYDKKWVLPLAQTLKNLGAKSAWVVNGADGMDEITTTTSTCVAILKEGKIEEMEITPADFGLEMDDAQDLIGGDVDINATALRGLLEGETGAYRNIVLANTAAILKIHGSVETLIEGTEKAATALDNGSANQILTDYICYTREFM
ncbi:MAG: anthranilate phosphoribosyltransferase [Micavibrio sp.]|nr:anthranilate phosphoribosyltransferase [Micavibrio sp.]